MANGNSQVLTYTEGGTPDNPHLIEVYHANWKLAIDALPNTHPDFNKGAFVRGVLIINYAAENDKDTKKIEMAIRRHSVENFGKLLSSIAQGEHIKAECANMSLYGTLNTATKRLVDCTFGTGSQFHRSLFAMIEAADEEELEKLKQIYPEEIEAWKFSKTPAFLQLIDKLKRKTHDL